MQGSLQYHVNVYDIMCTRSVYYNVIIFKKGGANHQHIKTNQNQFTLHNTESDFIWSKLITRMRLWI